MRTCPKTQEQLYNPNFDFGRTHPSNVAWMKRASALLWADYTVSQPYITKLLLPLTVCEPRRAMMTVHSPKGRTHRDTKAARLIPVVPEYIRQYGCDPTPLIHPEYMSADESGPEDPKETHMQWKRRMAIANKSSNLADEALEIIRVFETTQPLWHTQEVSIRSREE